MAQRDTGDDKLASGLACGLWVGLVAVVLLVLIVVVAVYGFGL